MSTRIRVWGIHHDPGLANRISGPLITTEIGDSDTTWSWRGDDRAVVSVYGLDIEIERQPCTREHVAEGAARSNRLRMAEALEKIGETLDSIGTDLANRR